MSDIDTYFKYETIIGSIKNPDGVLIRITQGEFKGEYIQLSTMNNRIVYSRINPYIYTTDQSERRFNNIVVEIFNDIMEDEPVYNKLIFGDNNVAYNV